MMSANSSSIEQYLRPGRRAHLVGIGGVSMRPLGLVLRSMGMEITGSDMNGLRRDREELQRSGSPSTSATARRILRARTASSARPPPTTTTRRSPAARAAGIPIFERAQAWGHLMRSYKNAICVAGTHGKDDHNVDADAHLHAGAA